MLNEYKNEWTDEIPFCLSIKYTPICRPIIELSIIDIINLVIILRPFLSLF